MISGEGRKNGEMQGEREGYLQKSGLDPPVLKIIRRSYWLQASREICLLAH